VKTSTYPDGQSETPTEPPESAPETLRDFDELGWTVDLEDEWPDRGRRA
jgi:hypothetical protein